MGTWYLINRIKTAHITQLSISPKFPNSTKQWLDAKRQCQSESCSISNAQDHHPVRSLVLLNTNQFFIRQIVKG